MFSAVILVIVAWFFRDYLVSKPVVTDFESCAQAGNPVMESYPRQCKTQDGRSFVEPIAKDLSDTIVVDTPKSGDIVTSPIHITGKARGNWFFEASFPIELVEDVSNEVLARGIATAKGEWMTAEFVPFQAELVFNFPNRTMAVTSGRLVLKKDNPSGIPEYDDSISIPVAIDIASSNISMCRVTGCSGQICSDKEVITTCEYRADYACYSLAKCERQIDWQCGWTKTLQFSQCLTKGIITDTDPDHPM